MTTTFPGKAFAVACARKT